MDAPTGEAARLPKWCGIQTSTGSKLHRSSHERLVAALRNVAPLTADRAMASSCFQKDPAPALFVVHQGPRNTQQLPAVARSFVPSLGAVELCGRPAGRPRAFDSAGEG